MWQTSKSFQAGARLANEVPMDRFPAFLERILASVTKNERPFTDAEEAKLLQVMGLSAEHLQILIDACTSIFERAAMHSATVFTIKGMLDQAGLSAAPLAVFQDVWRLNGPALICAFKEKALGAPDDSLLVDVQWRIHLQVAGGRFRQLCEPSAVLQLGLASQGKEIENYRTLELELSHEELFGMFEKLDQIQEQLDCLS